jgi:hypothetical protein
MYRRAVANIQRMIRETGALHKQVALGAGMSASSFTQKLRGGRTHFFIDEMEAVARFFRSETGRPLTGFPFVEWGLMDRIDRELFGWNGTKGR